MNLTSGAKYLVDTNILLYSVDRQSPFHVRSKEILEAGLQQDVSFVVAHQNLVEFVAVLTRGYGVERKQAVGDAQIFASRFDVIFPLPTTLGIFFQLIDKEKTTYPFDLYLTATMLDNQITRIITGNGKDFRTVGLEEIIGIE